MIYLFDKDEKLIKIIRKPAIKTALQKYSLTKERYVSDRLTVEMKSLNDDELEKVEYMAIQTMEDAHTFHYFYVAQKSSENLTTLIGVQSGIEELRKSPVFDKRPKNAFAKNVINDLLKGTNWQARFVGETTQRSTSFYYISVFDALKKACEVWDLEMQFFVEMNGNRIGARYIDFKRKIGQAVGKRVVYGHNALQILQEVERTNIFTALVGRGKGEQVSSAEESGKQANGFGRKITFEDVVWSTASEKPINKPKGQKYVELPAMTKLYGIKNADGSMRPKIGFVEFAEEENPEVLIERTYKALVDAARPQLTLKTSSVYLRGAKVGDTIRVVRHDKKLDYDTRIFEITFNRLNDQSSDIKLGDRIGESNEAKAQTIAEKVVDDFVSNEFSDFVQKLPDFLPSPDGFNNNWYGAEDPTVKYPGKVLINDIWFKPDPEHEGHKIILRWTGEVWDEILRSYDKELLTKRISEEIANFDKTFQSVNEQNKKKIDEILQSSGASTLLAHEAKRIGLDSIARLEAFKSQSTSAQTALSGDLDVLKRTIANDIRPKQAKVEIEIAKQVEALTQTKNELSGIKSAQAVYEESTARRLAELVNVADGKASKSALAQTAEELASKIASVQASGRNLFLNSLFKKDISKTGIWTTSTYTATIDSTDKYLGHNALKIVGLNPSGRDGGNPKITYPALGQFGKVVFGSTTNQDVTISFYAKANKNGIMLRSRLGNIGYKNGNVILSTEIKRYVVHIPKSWTNLSVQTTNEWLFNFNQEGTVWIWMPKFEISDVDTSYSEAPEDIEGQISAIESNFRQRADALDAGVSRLIEGLRTKADISSLNVTAENIRQSVKSLETSTQNKLDQKLSMAEFEVRAGSIRQEILNATKDKADKTLVVAEAGKLREEFSNLRVGGTNLLKGSKGPFLPDRKPANFDNNVLYAEQTSVHMEQGQEYIISAKTDGNFTAHHDGNKESDNVVLWIMDKDIRNYQIVSDLKTGTTGTKFIWNKPTGIYHLRVNTYHKNAAKSVWDVKIEKGTLATDWSPAPEDTDGLITEAKATFERTAQGLRTDMSAIQEHVNKEGQRQEVLRRYTREESAQQANAVRELVARNYVGKSDYQEDVKGLERRFSAISTQTNNDIATKIAQYKQTVDGRFADISSLISGKANQTDFQRVQETSRLYERILGNTNNSIADNIARMALTSQLFQVEVSKASASGRNLFLNSLFKRDLRDKYSTYKLFDDASQTKGQLAVSIDSDNQFRGVNTLKIVSTFNGKIDNQKITFNIGGNSRIGREDELKNKSVRFSFWAKSTVNNTNFQVRPGYRSAVKGISLTTDWQFYDIEFIRNENSNATSELILHIFTAATVWIAFPKVEIGTVSTPFSEAPEDTDEAVRSVQSQLSGSWAVQNLTSAGSIVSQINATNNQILIEAEKIRLKGKTLLDELTAIQGYFKRLFVGEGTFATLNADVIRTNSITADKLVMDMAMARRFVSSDLFTDTLAAKEAFINKLRSVVVTATLLEGYRGRIGGFQIGTHDNDPSSFWLTGLDQFKVGMSNGRGRDFQTAFWANWGNTWGRPGPLSWYVTLDGQMYCNNNATFHRVVDFSSTCSANFYGANSFYKDIYMRNGSEIYGTGSTPRAGGKNSVVWWNQVGDGSVKYHIDMASDKRLKENIVDSNIVALDKIKQLKMKSFDFISSGKHEEVGLIAQEVEAILPSVISKNPEKADDYLHIDYVAIVPYLIKSIQELNQKIEEMEKTVA